MESSYPYRFYHPPADRTPIGPILGVARLLLSRDQFQKLLVARELRGVHLEEGVGGFGLDFQAEVLTFQLFPFRAEADSIKPTHSRLGEPDQRV